MEPIGVMGFGKWIVQTLWGLEPRSYRIKCLARDPIGVMGFGKWIVQKCWG
jgi:hypothetical protein